MSLTEPPPGGDLGPPATDVPSLNDKLDRIIANGRDSLAELRRRVKALRIAAVVGALVVLVSIVLAVIAIRASTRANAAIAKAETALFAQQRQTAIADHDRCLTGNDLRRATVELSRGFVDYVDLVLAALTSSSTPRVRTPEEQAQDQRAADAFGKVRQAQIDKVNDPALMQKNCDVLYPIPPQRSTQ